MDTQTIQHDNSLVSLSNLTDYQKCLLAEFSYIDLSLAGKALIYDGDGIQFSELSKYMRWPNEPFCRGIINGEQFEEFNRKIFEPSIGTDKDLCKEITDAGLGHLILLDYEINPKTGFCAITFKDHQDNIGISYRGTDFDYSHGCIKEWIFANLGGHLMCDNQQGQQASAYFKTHSNSNGQNYVFGHSLGGYLAQRALLDHYELIKEAFSINGTPISPSKLETQEARDMFNSSKLNFYVIAGDVVSLTKDTSLFKDNVKFVENKHGITTKFTLAHTIDAAVFDHNGNFKLLDREKTMNEFKSKCESSKFRFFGKNGWDVIQAIQNAEGWLSGRIQQPPKLLKDSVIEQTIHNNKIPISEDSSGNINRILGITANAWKWTVQTASTMMKPIDHTIRTTSGLLTASAIECFICPQKISDHFAIWAKELKNFDFMDWAQDMCSQFGIQPQRLNGTAINSKDDFDLWKQEVSEHMAKILPEWIQADALNCTVAKAIVKEERQRDCNGDSRITNHDDSHAVVNDLLGENNKYTHSIDKVAKIKNEKHQISKKANDLIKQCALPSNEDIECVIERY